MVSISKLTAKLLSTGAIALILLASAGAGAREDVILHAFQDGTDGAGPYGGLIADKTGNLYGTTPYGGKICKTPGCGIVFEIAPGGAEKILYTFPGLGKQGRNFYVGPWAGVIADEEGNLFGTTVGGGYVNNNGCGGGCGTVFDLAPDGTETILYAFTGRPDGSTPYAGLLRDAAWNLYGTTEYGGNKTTNCLPGCGTVFKIAAGGKETVLYSFLGGSDGAYPYAGLIADKTGNLYGTTSAGGSYDGGTAFKLAPNGSETVLHVFGRSGDGARPVTNLMMDAAGNLYGTTGMGGNGFGTVFKIAPDGTETILYSFHGEKDGGGPNGPLIADKDGNLYGTTGGTGKYGFGTVFELFPDGSEKILHAFAGGNDGANPEAGLILKAGYFYSTTSRGGAGVGTVFKLKK